MSYGASNEFLSGGTRFFGDLSQSANEANFAQKQAELAQQQNYLRNIEKSIDQAKKVMGEY